MDINRMAENKHANKETKHNWEIGSTWQKAKKVKLYIKIHTLD